MRCDAIRWLPRVAAIAFVLLAVLGTRPALPDTAIVHGQGLLWRIDGAGSAPSHLFGTMHITDARVRDLAAPVREAFENAASATFEVILTDADRAKMARAMVLSDGRTLDTIVDSDLFEGAAATGLRYGLPAGTLKVFKPWALATVFSVPRAELARGAAGDLPLDQWLQDEATRRGTPVHALESADEQIALFNDLPEPDQIQLLAAAVRGNDQIDAVFEEMTRSYLARDVGAIYRMMLAQAAGLNGGLAEMFLLRFNESRNRIMVERMGERLREGGAFIAVGALHLPGETGLLRLLEERGYTVTRAY